MTLVTKLEKAGFWGRNGAWAGALALVGLTAAGLHSVGCSSDFAKCEESLTCGEATNGAGAGGQSDEQSPGEGPGGAGGQPGHASGTSGDAGAATEAEVGGGGAGSAEPTEPDTTAPTVLEMSPSDGESGVRSDAALVIEFSEPMNKVATQAAYQSPSTGLSAGAVTFSWNAAATELTITPNADLEYAEGDDASSVAARAFEYFISTAAEDQAGNSLAQESHAGFSTLRRITQTLQATDPALTGGYKVYEVGGGSETPVSYLWVGCLEANEVFRALVTFELAALPQGIEEFETASVRLYQTYQSSYDRTPYQALGDLQLVSISYAARDRAAYDSIGSAQAIGKFGTAAAMGYKSVLVTSTLAADYESRARSQYGVRFATKLNTDGHHDYVSFAEPDDANPPELEATYLVP